MKKIKWIWSFCLTIMIGVILIPSMSVFAYPAAKSLPVMTGNQAQDVANVAQSQLGYTESSGTIYGNWWNSVTNWGVDYTYLGWCSMFACWCANKAGAGLNIAYDKNGASPSLEFDFLKSNGATYNTTFTANPQIGDFIFFGNASAEHVAIVTGYNASTKTVTFVGGNQGNGAGTVSTGTCSWSSGAKWGSQYVLGFGRPKYSGNMDNTAPVISNFKITNLTPSGYTVTCTVTDDVGVTEVKFPTWPDANGEWNPVWHVASLSGSATNRTATFNVNVMDHHQLTETKYATQVYAYDAAGNQAFKDTTWVYVPNKSQKVSDGTYHIVSALDEDYGLDIAGGSTDSGTAVQVYKNAKDDVQTFDLKYLGNGEYSITSTVSGLNMDVFSAGTTNGTSIIMYTGNETDAQKWYIRDAGKGYVYLISKCNGLYVDVAGGKIDGGASTQMYTGNETDAQKWRLVSTEDGEKTIADGEYHIVSEADQSLGLDMEGGAKEDKTNIQLYGNTADPIQTFAVAYQGDGTYEIYSPIANKSLDAAGALATSGTNLQIYTRNDTPAQRWRIIPVGDGSYYIVNKLNNLAVDILGNVIESGRNVQLYARNETIAQKWKFKPLISESDGHYSVTDTGTNIRTWGNSLGITRGSSAGFYFGTSKNSLRKYTVKADVYTEDGLDVYINDYAGELNPGTQYYYQFFSNSENGTEVKGNLSSFKTEDKIDDVPSTVLSKPDAVIEYNGNKYYRFDTCVEHWISAKRACESMGGHLVTITSQGEQDIVTNLVNGGSDTEYWAGGTDRSSEGKWQWITGEGWNYNNWYGSQPDNTLGMEDYLTVFRDTPGKWNDSLESYTVKGEANRGFICEVEKAETFQITYHLNGGTLKGQNPSSYTSDNNKLTLESPTKEHYVFLGWFDAETNGRQITPETACTGDLDLYAYWEPVKYSLYFDANGGTISGNNEKEITYGEVYGELPVPVREGYGFTGWYAGSSKVDETTVCNGNASVTAGWSAKKITVTFDSNGGGEVSPKTKEVTYDSSYGSLPEAVRDGYVFLGWFLGADSGEQILAMSIVKDANAHTLYAHWQKEEEPPHVHSYSEQITKKATCTEDGIKTYTCSECGDYYTEVIKATGHQYSSWKISEKATCQKEGEEQRICENCGNIEKRTVEKTDHQYQESIIAPTCTSIGYTEHTCMICGDSYKDNYKNYTDHTVVTDQAVEATCTHTGLTEGSHCSVCGKIIQVQKVIEKKEHRYDEGVVTEESTCIKHGHKTFICQDCGYMKEEELPLTDHTEVIDPEVKATCELYGLSEGSHCSVCGETIVKQEVLPKSEHKWNSDYTIITGPTCEEDGYEVIKCSVCGAEKEGSGRSITKLGHKWDDGTVTKAATENEEGVMTYKCTVCDATKTESIPSLSHTHSLRKTAEKAATCTKEGNIEYWTCDSCGKIFSDSKCSIELRSEDIIVPPTGHKTELKNAKDATCTVDGYSGDEVCKVCGDIIKKGSVIPATGHTVVIDPAVEPTTTTTGLTEGSHCSVCGAVIKAQEVIPRKAEGEDQNEEPKEDVTPSTPSDPDHPDVEEQEKAITTQEGDGDPKGSTYIVLSARVKKSAKTSNTLAWSKVSGASRYIIYGNKCGASYHFEKLAEVKGTSYTHKGLKKGTYYKYLVVAYKEASGRRTVLATSKAMHAATTGGKVGNCKKLKLNKTSVTIKKKKIFKIKAKEIAASKKMKIKRHRKIAYESSNPKIATVTSSGKIKGIKKGSCKIYVYAQNGVYKVVKVKVK